MYRFEPRDKSGPMDIDPSPYDTARLDAFQLPMEVDGPARKRLHCELDAQSPFRAQAAPGFAPFSSSNPAPLLFAVQNTPQKSQPQPYDLRRWYLSEQKGNGQGSGAVEDVEMDSPARPLPSTSSGSTSKEPVAGPSTLDRSRNELTKASVEDEDDAEEDHVERKDRKFARGAVTRTNKKRREARRERDAARSDGEDYGTPVRYSESSSRGVRKSEHQHHYNLHMSAPALRHSEIPSLLLGYLQFFVNAFIVVFCLYIAVQFVLTVRRDVNDRMREYSVEILQEIAECTNLYLTNRCDPTLRVPAMENPCKAWEACMSRDPTMVGRINIIAETFAGVINSFVDPISWKTMSFTLVTLTFLVIITNSALFNLRSRTSSSPTTASEPPTNFWPPPSHTHFMPQLPPQVSHLAHGGATLQNLALGHAPGGGMGSDVPQIGWNGGEKEKKKGWW